MNLHPIYALVIASLMVPAVALALMADRVLAAEPQMPEAFQGTWCGTFELHGSSSFYGGPCPKLAPDSEIEIEETVITATGVNSPTTGTSCVVRQVTKIDVCPWGMIFKNWERARALRPFQINPWGPGYHIVLRCTNASKHVERMRADWFPEKDYINVSDRAYRCPWDRRGAAAPGAERKRKKR